MIESKPDVQKPDKRKSASFFRPLVAVAALASLAACQQTSREVQHAVGMYAIGDYATAAAILKPETLKKNENFVLNNCRYGSAALAAGQLPEAENAFLAAYEVINGVKTNDGGRTLGAALVFEGVKVWKGEPFERAMAHYYLGLIYLIHNDYENATAAFRNSLFKLREYASENDKPNPDQYTPYESNFALGYFGLGFSYMRQGRQDLSDQNFALAQKLQPGLAGVIAEAKRPTTNVLIFVDYNFGPQRAARGWYNSQSAFGPTPAEAGPVPQVAAYADGQPVTSGERYSMVDTLAMAQDQKWQDIDTIRAVKAGIGTGAMAAGTVVAAEGARRRNTNEELAGVGIALVGAAIAASSQADVRYWEMLPRTVYVIPASLTPGEHTIQVLAGASSCPPFKVTVKPAGEGDTVLYIRLR
jgi:tetratricopeptide (TPR) repeat protein